MAYNYQAPQQRPGYGPPATSGAPPPSQYAYGQQPGPAQFGQQPGSVPQSYGQPAPVYGQQQQQQYAPQGAPFGQQQPYGSQAAAPQKFGAPQSYGGAPAYNNAYPAPAGAGLQMPPGADPQLWNWFKTVDTDRSGFINSQELQQALINGDWSPFSLETVQLMITLFDRDGSGTIGFDEFVSLWKYIEDWKRIFQQFDNDRSGRIDRLELKQALQAFGYNVSDRIVDMMIKKFARNGAVDITFDAFICCCVTVKSLSEAFQRLDTDRDGWVNMSHETFLELVIGARH
ncbi:programmed cell death 6-like protein [Phlyctochytrium arcticum]|nr:programmed cell death 6-like protein [Phlyctochytrium arcticum]